MNNDYQPEHIETAVQDHWTLQHSFKVQPDPAREKFYCLAMLPYPSGELHMGHVRNYTLADVISRYQRLLGKNVLQPMGWDAFGLPAENAAIKHKLPPAQWTYQNIEQMREQLKQLGLAFDWSREITTCKPDFYRWEQWLFIKLYEKGLAYKKNGLVNWDPVDQTVLANEQVINGCGWRSGAPVERREISQWFLKISAYADELLDELDNLDGWPEQVRTMQRNWIGRSLGTEVQFKLQNSPLANIDKLTIFTTRADTLMGCTYLAIASQHPLAQAVAKTNSDIQAFNEKCKHLKVAEADLAKLEKAGLPTGLHAIHPISGATLPIWVANYVLMDYGAGAVMAVPAHDERDFEFAQHYQLPSKPVIKPADDQRWDFATGAMTADGTLIDAAQFTGLSSAAARKAITDFLTTQQLGHAKIHYRLRDWGVSRQRYWGAPIPMIICDDCGTLPVPEKDLPVILPENITPTGSGSPLASCPEFYQTTCPQCTKPAQRETDTFDTFMESAWYYTRYCCPDQHQAMLDDRACFWTPVDQYIGGVEHSVMHLLYARFMHKLLRDEGLLNSNEPFKRLLTQGMVLKDGSKMSKSKGNTVSPESLIKKYGADTVRLFAIFAAPPEQSLEWSDRGVDGSYRFLRRLWLFASQQQAIIKDHNHQSQVIDWQNAPEAIRQQRREVHDILRQANNDMEKLQFNTVASAAMKLLNILQACTQQVSEDHQAQSALLTEAMSILLRLLYPITPHLCHTLWTELEFGNDILNATWPKVDKNALKTDTVELMIQVNGKLRSRITVSQDADQQTIEAGVLKDDIVKHFMTDKTLKKIIVVPKRLVNVVIG